jgi:putative Mg2+ transporter-C (MgtC) family protein
MEMIPMLDQLQITLYTLLAAFFGAIIGLERERAEKPAGMRTMSLIAASSSLIVALGVVVNEFYGGAGDPTRALHGVITGIGFLGAGTIAINNRSTRGGHLTTAATIFAAAAVGVTVGLGAPISAFGVTLLILGALRMGVFLEKIGVKKKYDRNNDN